MGCESDPSPAQADTKLGSRGQRGGGRKGPGCAEDPAAVAGLSAKRPRYPRAVTGDVGTTMTTGRESAEGVSPKGHFEETVGVDLG